MDNFGFEGDSDDEEEQSGNDKSTDSEEERHCQPDMERVLINPYQHQLCDRPAYSFLGSKKWSDYSFLGSKKWSENSFLGSKK